jgi:hypothetical protein
MWPEGTAMGKEMVTYKQIQDDIRTHHNRAVKNCWIAHVKELNGLAPRQAANRQSASRRLHPCPEGLRPLIEESMRRLGMLPAYPRGVGKPGQEDVAAVHGFFS